MKDPSVKINYLSIVAIILALVALIWILFTDNNNSSNIEQEDVTIELSQMQQKELVTEDLIVGTGEEAMAGSNITVNYVGTLTNGTKFDSSYDSGRPFSFELGAGRVIQGWDLGVVGMKVGGKRRLTIPPELGYGQRGAPPVIGPNETLIFEVELLSVD